VVAVRCFCGESWTEHNKSIEEQGNRTMNALQPPTLSFFASVTVQVGEAISIGTTIDGERKVVQITGGTVLGE
jgi:hypothetical protein